jgi:cytoplasmic iron level regulating protein YaaA (DUF328/UPF0246 family)
MKIIVSPSKTQTIQKLESNKVNEPEFLSKAEAIALYIQGIDEKTLGYKMHIKGALLERTYREYQNFFTEEVGHAIASYTGTVFKELKIDDYNLNTLKFMEEHLRIMSSLYGVLKPFDGIRPYRLDMNMSLFEDTLYKQWDEFLNNYFDGEEIIVLASGEYAKMINRDFGSSVKADTLVANQTMIQIEFRTFKEDAYKNLGYYSKVARGKMAHAIITNQINKSKKIKTIAFDGYSYNDKLSTKNQWFFTN